MDQKATWGQLHAQLSKSDPVSESRVIRPGHWERAQISEMGIIGS
jgi:hypothetical protein